MAITILNEWLTTEGSNTSDLESIFSKLNLYYKATITNVAYSTVKILSADTLESITFRGIEIDDDGAFKYFLFNGEEYFKYWYYSLKDTNYSGAEDMPLWKTAQGLDFYYLLFEQENQITITTYNSSDAVIESTFIDIKLTPLGQKVPSKYGFNMFEYFTARHLRNLKWSNNTFNELIIHWETSTKKTTIKNLTTGKTIHTATSPGGDEGTFGLYFAKKVQDIYPSASPLTYHKEGDTVFNDDIEVDAGSFGAGEIEKASLCLDKTIYSDDTGDDNNVLLTIQYLTSTADGDGDVGALTITADAAFTLNNCIDASVIVQNVDLTQTINIGKDHVIYFEQRKTFSTATYTMNLLSNIQFDTSNIHTTIKYLGQTIATYGSELSNTNLIKVTITRNGTAISVKVENSGIGGGENTDTATLTSNVDFTATRLVEGDSGTSDFERLGNITISQSHESIRSLINLAHVWKCDSLTGGDIPDEGVGDLDYVKSTQQKNDNVNVVNLELTPSANHSTYAGDIIAYLDDVSSHSGGGHVYIENIKMLGTFTPEYDDSILAQGSNKIEFQISQNPGLDYAFNRVIDIDYDAIGCYMTVLFNHPNLGYVSYPFEGAKIEGLDTNKGDELTPFQTTMVNVSELKELLSIESNIIITLSTQVNKEYWDILKEIYNARKVFLYIGDNGNLDDQENWISVQVEGSPNLNFNTMKTSAPFTVELILPTKLNNKL